MNQESWTTAHVNAYKYFGGVTRIIQCDNLKTGVQKAWEGMRSFSTNRMRKI